MPYLAGPIKSKNGVDVVIRLLKESDTETIYEWQKHPDTRRYFNNPTIPTFLEHQVWIKHRLAQPLDPLYIILEDDQPAGLVRLDREDDEDNACRISILIAPDKYKRGLGKIALTLVMSLHLSATWNAEILPENEASLVLFKKAGFVHYEDNLYRRVAD